MQNKLQLREVTFLAVDCVCLERVIDIASLWQRYIEFGEIKILSSIPSSHPWVKKINPIQSKEEYSRFAIREMADYVSTSHVLIFQYDGFILNPSKWTEEFLQYDYIGAAWRFNDGNNIGNGGFCLRSKKLLELLKQDSTITAYHPEDLIICRNHYESLVEKGIRFAPPSVAANFSFEGRWQKNDKWQGAFGFHGYDVTDVIGWNFLAYVNLKKDRNFIRRHIKRLFEYRKLLWKWRKQAILRRLKLS